MTPLRLSAGFRPRCVDRVAEVFRALGGDIPNFRACRGDVDFDAADVCHRGKRLRIEVYDENVVMQERLEDGRDRLYECYLPAEFVDEDALIHGFCSRLNRFLTEGKWERHSEGETTRRLVQALRSMGKALQRVSRSLVTRACPRGKHPRDHDWP